jgi:PucR family transcriptional regulator, purine catabolism regulatory protein
MVDERNVGDELTMRELVDQGGLHLEAVAGREGLDKVIEAVYIGDLDDPTPWMVEGSLLLTTGPRLEAEPESGVHLIQLLKQSGMVGIGVAIMPHVREIPAAMLDAADEEGLPLLRVPEGTPFREITSYVYNALASRDMHRLRRSIALQRQLVEVLLSHQDPGDLVRRLGELLGAGTLLFDAGGRLLQAGLDRGDERAEVFARGAWDEYRALLQIGARRSVMDLGGRHVAFRDICVQGVVEQVLMAVYPEGSLISEFADAALTFAQRLLEVELTTGHNVVTVRRRSRAGLLEMLLHGRGAEAELGERLLYQGIEPGEPWRLMVLTVGIGDGTRVDHPSVADAMADVLLATVDRLLEERRLAFVSRRSHEEVLVLTPLDGCEDAERVRAVVSDLAENAAARLRTDVVQAGVSAALRGLDCVPRAAGQARLALRHAQNDGSEAQVTLFDDLGLRYRALDSLPDKQLRQLAAGTVDRLHEADRRGGGELFATLESFLAHNGSVGDTAAALFVHRNTLHKRLRRIEEVLGVDLDSSGGRVEAYLGVRAAEVLATRHR